jgi:uncharacterized protein YjiS (DUF1127 family)
LKEKDLAMKLFADNGSALLGGTSSPIATVAGVAKRVADAVTAPVRAYLHREAVYRELAELDERMLADIGLNRGDIGAVAEGLRRSEVIGY